LKRNFLRPPGGNPLLVIYPDQEKSRKLLEASLTERNCQLLSLYVSHYRPVLPGADRSSYLFPAATSRGYVSPTTFAGVIAKIVKRRTGIHMHVNLWRHVMATKLGERTKRAEDGGKLLGHLPNSSSTRRYVRLGTRLAARQLREITDEARSQGIQLLMARSD
jgi:site-specific recombinase XerD